MYKLKIKDKEYNIKFGYEAILKSRMISKMVAFENKLKGKEKQDDEDNLTNVEDMLLLIPEIILVGLQKNHKDEFVYDLETGHGKKESLGKVFEMMDDYFDQDNADIMELYQDLQNEMMNEGFLKSVFQKEVAIQKKLEQKTEKEN